jgi:hypothetical protein
MSGFHGTALIGHSNLVGGNLARQRAFDETYDWTTIDDIAGRSFELLVVSGAPTEKHIANADPVADRRAIGQLIAVLDQVDASRVVLISTVDVFGEPVEIDESTPVGLDGLHEYGHNRRLLEEMVLARFDALVVRLPGLYGRGLKKNVIHDLLREQQVGPIDSRRTVQFYGLDRLWRDVTIALDNELTVVHLATEPVSVSDVAREGFGLHFENAVAPIPIRYDVRTVYAPLFGGRGGYIETRERVLTRIRAFVESERATLD